MAPNLAIIPARGGSKGIPGKNLLRICNKHLIEWTIESAHKANCIDRVIVSTDSDEISDVSLKAGAEVPFLRPKSLSDDFSSTESAIHHCIEWLRDNENYMPENIFLLQPTSPLRFKDSIDLAYSKFINKKADSLLSTSEFKHFLWKNEDQPVAQYDYKKRPRRQDIRREEYLYKENGSIYITKTSIYKKYKNRLGGKIASYIMSEEESFEIDNFLDLDILETIMNKNIEKI